MQYFFCKLKFYFEHRLCKKVKSVLLQTKMVPIYFSYQASAVQACSVNCIIEILNQFFVSNFLTQVTELLYQLCYVRFQYYCQCVAFQFEHCNFKIIH